MKDKELKVTFENLDNGTIDSILNIMADEEDIEIAREKAASLLGINISKIDTEKDAPFDINIVSEADALNYFYFKLRQTNINDTIENQLNFLSDIYKKNNENSSKESLVDFQDHFIKSLYNDFTSAHKVLFQDKNTEEDKFQKARLVGHLRCLYNTNNSKAYKNKVINKYYDIIPQYESYFRSYIISKHRFDYTCNSEKVFRMHFDLIIEHENLCKDINPTNHYEHTCKLINKYIPITNSLKQCGLDDGSYSSFFENVIVGKFNAALYLICDPILKQEIIEGVNDAETIRGYIDLLDRVKSEIEIPFNCQKSIDKLTVELNSRLTSNNKGGNGCLVILPFILSGLTLLLSLVFIAIIG